MQLSLLKRCAILTILILEAAWFLYAAQTKPNMSWQVKGLLPIANGGTNTDTTSAGYSFQGPASGTGAPSFQATPDLVYQPALIYPSKAHNFIMLPTGTASNVSYGITGTGTSCTNNLSTTTTAVNCTYTSSGVTVWAFAADANLFPVSGHGAAFSWEMKIERVTSCRIYIHLGNLGVPQNANPAVSSAAEFYFCTDTGAACSPDNTTWQIATADGTTRSATSTSATPDTNLHRYSIIDNGSSFDFQIDGTSIGTRSSNLPAAAVILTPRMGMLNLDASATFNTDVEAIHGQWTPY